MLGHYNSAFLGEQLSCWESQDSVTPKKSESQAPWEQKLCLSCSALHSYCLQGHLIYNRCSRNISDIKFNLNGLKYKIFFKKTFRTTTDSPPPYPHLQFNWQWTYVIWFASDGCSLAFNHNGCFSVGMLFSNY